MTLGPLRFQYTVELNLDNPHAKHFAISSMFDDIALSVLGSSLYKTDDECIQETNSVADQFLLMLEEKEPESFFIGERIYNSAFYPKREDAVSGKDFANDEMYRFSISDELEQETVVSVKVQITELDIGDNIHFSERIH